MIGQKISHYRIEAELGRGGMGVVYRAHDEVLRRDVALKVLSGEFLGPREPRERILAEARAASALNHPGITTIYEVAEEGNQILLVMELAQGKTLRALLAEGPMEPRALARLGASIAETLEAAHDKGVIHGDIKPENVIVQANERMKLLDFGIARQMAAQTLTMTKSAGTPLTTGDSRVAGTLAYMAPELLRGDATDARADLFSLGVVLYELASGRRPFPGPTVSALMAQILDEPTPTLAGARHIVPAEMGRIIRKLLEKKPETRYQSAREVKVDLTNLARDLENGALLPPAVAGKRALAVLPFKLLTPNPEDDYLSVALADAVINHLSASGEFLVRPASTVQRYAKQTIDPLTAARELNVQVVVDGSIQKFGPKLRVHFQAWNAADGASLLSAKHDADMAELFGLQDSIGEELTKTLGLKPSQTSGEPAEPPTKDPAAYQVYLRAAERLSRLNRWDTRTAIEMLEEATRLDPRFAVGWARLAEAYMLMATVFDPSMKWFRQADSAIKKALAIDKNNADAHCSRGRVLWTPAKRFQNRLALHALRQALKLNPGCHQALTWQCLIFLHIGLHEEAKEGLSLALAAHPEDAFVLVFTGQVANYMGNFEEAREFQIRALHVDSTNIWANMMYPAVLLQCGQLDKAEERIRIGRQILPDEPWLVSCEALLSAKRGDFRKADQTVSRALRSKKTLAHTHHMWHAAAATYALIGKRAAALGLLRKAASLGLPNYPLFRDDIHFATMQTYGPYLRFLTEMKREWEGYRREFGNA
ncbi:MAG TPA: protein kinase [Candidatus Acidoferrales bacterium]|nr:protein kinase [Candidatus Acidoferrales bacterium]